MVRRHKVYVLRPPARGVRQASSKETTASEGNTISERTVGAPTSADATIAAAQKIAFVIRYARLIVITLRLRNVTPNGEVEGPAC
jgi:hypothetical protein